MDTVHECYRQTDGETDGQTDRITIPKTVQRRASHGKKPGHIMAMCHKRLAKLSGVPNQQSNNEGNQGNPVQHVYTDKPMSLLVEVDPLFKTHGVNAVLNRPDETRYSVQMLRDTGAYCHWLVVKCHTMMILYIQVKHV